MSNATWGGLAHDRARGVARTCWEALARVAPEAAEQIASAADAVGETWLRPRRDVRDVLVTRPELAEMAGVSPEAVSMWGSRGKVIDGVRQRLTRYPDGRYSLAEAEKFFPTARRGRLEQAEQGVKDRLLELSEFRVNLSAGRSLSPARDASPWSECTAHEPDGSFCELPIADGSPISLCPRHLALAWQFAEDRLRDTEKVGQALRDTAIATSGNVLASERVYYLRIGDLVKIGYSANLAGRLRQYPPTAEFLTSEAGGRDLEVKRHRQFEHLLAGGREWFHPGADLLAHVAGITAGAATGPAA